MKFLGKVWDYLKPVSIGVIGALIGGIVIHYYTQWISSPALMLKVLSQDIIVEKKSEVDQLIITYDGKRLDKLSKTTLAIQNIGGTTFLRKDLVTPICISFDCEILGANIDAENSVQIISTTTLSKKNREINLSFDLLNPNEQIIFSILAIDNPQDLTVSARVVGINNIPIEKVTIPKPVSTTSHGYGRYFLYFFIIVFISLILKQIGESTRVKKSLNSITNHTYLIPDNLTKSEFTEWLKKELSFALTSERDTFMTKILGSIPDDAEQIDAKAIQPEIEQFIVTAKKNQAGAIILCLIIIGFLLFFLY